MFIDDLTDSDLDGSMLTGVTKAMVGLVRLSDDSVALVMGPLAILALGIRRHSTGQGASNHTFF